MSAEDSNNQPEPEAPTSQTSIENESETLSTVQGINDKIVQKIRSLIEIGKMTSSDIDNRVYEQLRSFPDDATSIDSLFNEFNDSDLTGVVNKGAFLCNFIKQWKLRNPQQLMSSSNDSQNTNDQNRTHKPGPDETKLKVND